MKNNIFLDYKIGFNNNIYNLRKPFIETGNFEKLLYFILLYAKRFKQLFYKLNTNK